jgi:hypothetical protein
MILVARQLPSLKVSGSAVGLSLLAIWNGIFSALAGSYFQIVPISQPVGATVYVSATIGLDYPNISNYYALYIAAVGVSTVMC